MQSADFRAFSYDEELQRAKWFKEDLDKGGWNEVHNSPDSMYWIKTFPDQEVPIKTLFRLKLPMSAKKAIELLSPANLEKRKKWDKAFLDQEILETYPDGSCVTTTTLPVSWPLTDRSYVLFRPAAKQVEWYGQEAIMIVEKDAWHPKKSAGEDGLVRATNGGNFTILIPDDKNPSEACKMFGLRNNNYNGWLPNSGFIIKSVVSKKLPESFNYFRQCMIEGYNKYFKNGN